MIEEEQKKKMIMPVVALVIVAVLVIALGSYAYWQITRKQQNRNVVGTACLNISFSESNDINLVNQYPMTDEEGAGTTPYTFTITNECNAPVNYVVGLESIEDENTSFGDYLNYSYLRLQLNNESALTYGSLNDLTNDSPRNYTLRATKKIKEGTLGANDDVTYELRLWIDEDTPAQNNDETLNTGKYFFGKVIVTAGQIVNNNNSSAIGVVSGDINTAGSEVKIGDEHFYVIGDDEETSGNVKLLAKYNLLVGIYEVVDDAIDTQNECVSMGKNWDYGSNTCRDILTYDDNFSNYNLQSSEAVGYRCEEYSKYIEYDTDDEETCLAAGMEFDNKEGCYIDTTFDDNKYDSIPGLGTPDIQIYCENGFYSASSFVSAGNYSYWQTASWCDYNSNCLKSNYSLNNNQIAPYVYYDNSKNIDSDNLVAPYINNYTNMIENEYGINVSDARLISIEEIVKLGCSSFLELEEDWDAYSCGSAPSWLITSNFWLGSAGSHDSRYLFRAGNDIHFGPVIYTTDPGDWKEPYPSAGVRPIISVSKSIFS